MTVNKSILLGRLTADPEVNYTPGGMAVCKFTVATSEKVKGEEVTEFHRCVSFDKQGETIGKYVTKGQQIYIEGKIKYGKYTKDEITRYTTDIIVRQFNFIGSKGQGQQNNQGQQNQNQGYQQQNQGQQQQRQETQYQQQGGYNPNQTPPDDDIPF